MTADPVVVRLTEDDVAKAAQAHSRLMLMRPPIVIGYSVIALILLASPWFTLADQELWRIVACDLIVFAGLAFLPINLVLYGAPRQARRQYREQPPLGRATTYRWTDTELLAESANGHGKYAWREIFACHDSKDVLLVYLSRQVYLPFPHRIWDNVHRDQFLACLKAAARPDRRTA